jgi:hypothetical protein
MRRLCAALGLMLVVAISSRHAGGGDSASLAAPAAVGGLTGTVKMSDGKTAAVGVAVGLYAPKSPEGAAVDRSTDPTEGSEPAAMAGEGGRMPGKNAPKVVAETTTDENGNYRLERVPAGRYRMIAGNQLRGMFSADVSVDANRVARKDVTLSKKAPPIIR